MKTLWVWVNFYSLVIKEKLFLLVAISPHQYIIIIINRAGSRYWQLEQSPGALSRPRAPSCRYVMCLGSSKTTAYKNILAVGHDSRQIKFFGHPQVLWDIICILCCFFFCCFVFLVHVKPISCTFLLYLTSWSKDWTHNAVWRNIWLTTIYPSFRKIYVVRL